MNINILILQIIFLVMNKKYSTIIDRIDALKRYTTRYLKKNDTFRSNCFIKMLVLLPEAHFHPIRMEARTKELFKKLQTVPPDVTGDVEVVPYETLWECVLELLD